MSWAPNIYIIMPFKVMQKITNPKIQEIWTELIPVWNISIDDMYSTQWITFEFQFSLRHSKWTEIICLKSLKQISSE